ncbi:MAG: thiamine pyrophosphate-dependent enzyme [Candidatus Aminicenantes bacterium]|nr:thiamine pyrophosphate-dependent enzyme [Candidatus Aminicenantes bacterium]
MNKDRLHPDHPFLYSDFFPTVWCSGCGIGTVVHSFIEALRASDIPPRETGVVSGMGCSRKISECLKLPSYSVSDGRVVDFSVRYGQEHPAHMIVAFLNNADFMLTGAEDFLHLKKSEQRLTIIYINNFIYSVAGNDGFPMTPYRRKSFDGTADLPFNIPLLASSVGAEYIARWTPLRAGWIKNAMIEGFQKNGTAVIEIISPCLVYDSESRRILDAAERMQFYDKRTVIQNFSPLEELDLREGKNIILGTFADSASAAEKQ